MLGRVGHERVDRGQVRDRIARQGRCKRPQRLRRRLRVGPLVLEERLGCAADFAAADVPLIEDLEGRFPCAAT